eukprot:jgi/Botrbrau1/15650/Bobra.4_1s0034.1
MLTWQALVGGRQVPAHHGGTGRVAVRVGGRLQGSPAGCDPAGPQHHAHHGAAGLHPLRGPGWSPGDRSPPPDPTLLPVSHPCPDKLGVPGLQASGDTSSGGADAGDPPSRGVLGHTAHHPPHQFSPPHHGDHHVGGALLPTFLLCRSPRCVACNGTFPICPGLPSKWEISNAVLEISE